MGEAEKALISSCNTLIKYGFKITLYLSMPNDNDTKIDDRINIVYLAPVSYEKKFVQNYIKCLYHALLKTKPDILLCHDPWNQHTLWRLLLSHCLRIPFFIFQHSAFYRRLLFPSSQYNLINYNSVLSCADMVFVLSREAELYFKNRGVNAYLTHNPIDNANKNLKVFAERKNWIVYSGRLDEPLKQINHLLRILELIIDDIQDVKLLILGSFNSAINYDNFTNEIKRLGLENNVILHGWVNNPAKYLQEAKCFISTSYSESFSLSIAEAQCTGVPCVIYDLEIAPAKDNPSLIRVPQGNFRMAASEVVNLLTNEDHWNKLSSLAKEKSTNFSVEAHIKHIIDCIENFKLYSKYVNFTPKEYQRTILDLSFYSSELPSWAK